MGWSCDLALTRDDSIVAAIGLSRTFRQASRHRVPGPLARGVADTNRIKDEFVAFCVVEAHRNRPASRGHHEDAGVETLRIQIAGIHEAMNEERELVDAAARREQGGVHP